MINEKKARKYFKEDISKIKNYEKAIADTTQTWKLINGKRVYFPKEVK